MKPLARILIAKAGLDGHDRGAKIIARALRDAGMEVIYSGLHQTSEQIVRAAVQEDVRLLGISILSGAHMTIFPQVLRLLETQRARDIAVFGGGIIPEKDMEHLHEIGVGKLFPPGTNTHEIADYIRIWVEKNRNF